jgi:hypothetical protein
VFGSNRSREHSCYRALPYDQNIHGSTISAYPD